MFARFVRNVICILVTIFLFLKIGSSCYKLYEIMCTSLDKDQACQEYSDVILLFGFFFACFFPYIPYIYFLQLILFLFVFCFLFSFLALFCGMLAWFTLFHVENNFSPKKANSFYNFFMNETFKVIYSQFVFMQQLNWY